MIPSFNKIKPSSCKSLAVIGLVFYSIYITFFSNHPCCRFSEFLLDRTQVWVHTPRPAGPDPPTPTTNVTHLVFGIAGSSKTWAKRRPYVDLWWRPNATRGHVWLERTPDEWPASSPPYKVNSDLRRFKKYDRHGHPATLRQVYMIKEAFDAVGEAGGAAAEEPRWLVMVDDDTVVFVENLVEVLNKYDHRGYFYLGGVSECVSQTATHSFELAFGGAGFAMSWPLARGFSRIADECLKRYPDLYGGDHVTMSCVSELGVAVTHHPGFHQFDLRGDISGYLSAHPKAPLLTFHHVDVLEPIFPSMDGLSSLRHLMSAAAADSSRLLQQFFCYHNNNTWSFSLSFGYSVHLYEKLIPPSVLRLPIQTFKPWRSWTKPFFMFNVREHSVVDDPCEAPHVFFFESVVREGGGGGVVSTYVRRGPRGLAACGNHSAEGVSRVRVFTPENRLEHVGRRRECCKVSIGSDMVAEIRVKSCGMYESLI
ncbi:hypothetical protein QJS04_geneDACA011336 [Acorus gramineus]|uniref:Uncharacterized protein n=1 Tax=Acorus gramineus TaxID=55184 RepID=A0AAV9AMK5_ACOGR|nr:hypothetical protein QJS04_geneDACA011336 [Acorus gramineus]